ncbi:MAG: hypothetical protein ACFFA3_16415 [Promethearchaeota archaeon]
MVKNKNSFFGLIALIIGLSGLAVGVYSVVNFQVVEGPSGKDGTDGKDALGGIIVKILDPDYDEVVSGNVKISAFIYGSENYSVSILRNGTEIGIFLPKVWNTSTIGNGWWNLSIIVIDIPSMDVAQDDVIVYVENIILSKIRGYSGGQTIPYATTEKVDFDSLDYDLNSDFDLINDQFIAPRDGYYQIHVNLQVGHLVGGYRVDLALRVNGILRTFIELIGDVGASNIVLTDTLWINKAEYIYFEISTDDPDGLIIGSLAYQNFFTILEL